MTRGTGTLLWMAPEVFDRGSESSGSTAERVRYGQSADVFSFGIIIWELWHRRLPYANDAVPSGLKGFMEAVKSGVRPCIDPSCPADLATLMQECWSGDVSMRPSVQSIVQRLENMLAKERETVVDYRRSQNVSSVVDLLVPSTLMKRLRSASAGSHAPVDAQKEVLLSNTSSASQHSSRGEE